MPGNDLYVEEHGDRDGPSIVFLHGGGLSGRMWRPQVERLREYRCVVPDLPEQGRSAQIKPFTLDDAARRIEELIEERCSVGGAPARAHLVGLSLGGAVALTVVRRRPELVERVVVSGTAAGLGRFLGAVSKWSAAAYRWFSTETLVKLSMKQFGVPAEYADMFREDLAAGATEALVRHTADALMALRLPDDAEVPVLTAVGSRETWFAKRAARKIAAVVPGALVVEVPGAGHVWNLEHPDLFADMVRAWCEGETLPAALRPLTP